jgi:hypothetical protein
VRSSAASTWAHLLLANLDDLLVATCREPAVAATAATVYYASEPTRRSRTHTRSRGAAVEPRERDEPRKPTTCVSGRLIRSCATRHVSGRGAHGRWNGPGVHPIFFPSDRGTTVAKL